MVFRRPRIEDVSPEDAAAMHERGAVLLDVREDDEWRAGHAPGATHVPLGELSHATGRLSGRQVLAVCRGGNRSGSAAIVLADAGIQVRNVAGGMSSWAAAGLAVVCDDGSPGTVV